ncbi:phosphoprotein phosphatase [Bremerella cremea]|uniref:Phosphoprotein phosphatase n=1 Tax=Bremerella cremea TaxID=1031537 RepID=A0A368KX37_9BACT|nr:phosphoprotein phosphatase [Bremerella cremea]
MSTTEKPLLILDVDETLLFATEEPLAWQHDFRVGPYYVYLRPYLTQFWEKSRHEFELAVWSSSGEDYLSAVLEVIVPAYIELLFAWSRDHCVQRLDPETKQRYFVKDLKKVKRKGFNLDRVLIVDDTPRKVERNFGNAVYVNSFFGDRNDDELVKLAAYLTSLRRHSNFRNIEKRRWQNQV